MQSSFFIPKSPEPHLTAPEPRPSRTTLFRPHHYTRNIELRIDWLFIDFKSPARVAVRDCGDKVCFYHARSSLGLKVQAIYTMHTTWLTSCKQTVRETQNVHLPNGWLQIAMFGIEMHWNTTNAMETCIEIQCFAQNTQKWARITGMLLIQ